MTEPQRLDVSPADREFVVAHPTREHEARRQARCSGCDYVLLECAPRGSVYLFDPTSLVDLGFGSDA